MTDGIIGGPVGMEYMPLHYINDSDFATMDPNTEVLQLYYEEPVCLASGWFSGVPRIFPKLKEVHISETVYIESQPRFTASIQTFYHGDTTIKWLGDHIEIRGDQYIYKTTSLVSVLFLARGLAFHFAETQARALSFPIALLNSKGEPIFRNDGWYNSILWWTHDYGLHDKFYRSITMGVAYLIDRGQIPKDIYDIEFLYRDHPGIFEEYPRLIRLINDTDFLTKLLDEDKRAETKVEILNRLNELGGPTEINFDLGELT